MATRKREKSIAGVRAQLARIERLRHSLVLTGSHRDSSKPDYNLDNVAEMQADRAKKIGEKYLANLNKAAHSDTTSKMRTAKNYSYSTRAGITG